MSEEEQKELRDLHRLEDHLIGKGFELNGKKKIRKLELEVMSIWEELS